MTGPMRESDVAMLAEVKFKPTFSFVAAKTAYISSKMMA